MSHLEIRMQPQQAEVADGAEEPLAATGTDDARPARVAARTTPRPRVAASGGGAAAGLGTPGPSQPASWGKVPRNAPCPCGSGKKYKHCHGRLH